MNYLVTSLDGQSEALHGGKLTVEEWGRVGQPQAVLVWRGSPSGSASMPQIAGDWLKSWPLMTIRSWERVDG